ncbi:MAG: family 78 glycoside hydrolase catalytic domain [Rikenellaceae bacterium]|nr:family 78 glycoside hydrolase catalytic domain [Rikenellaceae bacterium]
MKTKPQLLLNFVAAMVAILCLSCESKTFIGEKVAALDADAWNSSIWLSAKDAPVLEKWNHDRAADGASWFVSTITNEQKVTSAKWMTTGLGVYEIYLNGKPVGNEFLKPGFTHVLKTRRSFTYDITEAFDKAANAENQLSAQVTPGWWGDKIVTPNHHSMWGTKCAFRSVLELTYADGTKKLYGTNLENWKAGIAGPVKHSAIFDGEEYDAREKMGYEVADKLSTPEQNKEFRGEILPSEGAEVYLRHDLELKPVEAYIWKNVEGAKDGEAGKVIIDRKYKLGEKIVLKAGENLVIDFGQNCAGVPSFVFKATEGTTLTCLPGELLNDGNGARSRGMDGPEGSVHRENLRTPATAFLMKYTFGAGNKYVSYHPTRTFYGYRYATITADADVTIKSVTTIPVTSIAKDLEIGKISTGDESINKLISNTYWGQLSNYLSVPTDCPQRNERLGWTADTQVFAETGTFFADTRTFFHKWMRDMRDSQGKEGGFPGVAPHAQYGNVLTRLGWSDAGVIVPWTVWKQFGDKQIIDECWTSMELYLNHINETKYDHQTLIQENHNYQWADWLSYEPLESCSGRAFDKDGVLPEALDYWNYLSASYWAIDASMMVDMAMATGRDAAPYEQMVADAKSYMKEKFFNEDGTFKTDILNTMQTPALFALKNNLFDGEQKAQMIARLRENFKQHGNCLQTGFLGTSILMATLTENGMIDIAYELLFQRNNPSWLYSVDNGATTIWERWNSYMLDKGMGPRGMNSFNHYAYGCVCEWIWETAAGIASDPATPGFKHIIMKPQPDKRLGHLTAEYNSASGLIKSAWRYEAEQWIWEFTIPEGATATVTLPGESEAKEYNAGSYTVTM